MTRIATAVALLAFAFYLIFFAPSPVFLAAAALVGTLCYLEYANIVAAHQINRPGYIGLALGLAILFFPEYTLLFISCATLLLLVLLLRRPLLKEIAPEAACNLLGAIYACVPWRLATDLRHISVHLLFFALALNWVGDSTAFYVGRRFGKHKLAPSISPAKSWEGFVAAVLGAIVFGLLYLGYLLPQASRLEIVLIAAVGNIAGQVGDLVESAMKRGAALKDSGNILPGHGGILDRLDSSLFALPMVYLLSSRFNLF